MRIDQITYNGFGLPRESTLTPGPQWTVVLAENEAGKSTLLRAVRAALFGRVPPPPEEAVQPLKAAAVTATFSIGSGEKLIVTRDMSLKDRKKKAPTFETSATLGGREISEDELTDLLGLSEGLGHGLSAVGQPDLASGAASIGQLDDLLFGGGMGGVRQIGKLLGDVESELGKLVPNRRANSRRPIDVAVRDIVSAAERRKEASLPPAEHAGMVERQKELRRKAVALDAEAERAAAEVTRLDALLKAHASHVERVAARHEREAIGLDRPMSRDEAGNILTAIEERRRLGERLQDIREQRRQLEQDRAKIPDASPLDDIDTEAAELPTRAKAAATARDDAARKRERLSEVRNRLADLDGVASLDVDADTLLRRLGEMRNSIQAAAERSREASRRLRDAERAVERSEQDAAGRDMTEGAVEAVAAKLAAVDRLGDLDATSRALSLRKDRLAAEAADLLAAVGLKTLEGLPLPTEALARETATAVDAAKTLAADADRDLRHAQQARRDAVAELEEARGGKAPPSREDLEAARAERDAAVEAYLETAASGGDSSAAAEGLRISIQKADNVADARFDDAKRVAAAEKAARRVDKADREEQAASGRLDDAKTAVEAAARPLREKWAACDAVSLGPAETTEWLARRAAYADEKRQWNEDAAAHDANLAIRDEALTAAATAMAESGGTSEQDPVRWVVAEADRRRKERAVRESEAAKLPSLKRAAEDASDAKAEAEEAEASEKAALANLLEEAGLEATGNPGEAEEAVRRAQTADRLRREASSLEEEAAAAEARVVEYEAELQRVRDLLAVDERTRHLREPQEIAAASRERIGEIAQRGERLQGIRSFEDAERNLHQQISEVEGSLPTPDSLGVADLDAVERLALSSREWRELEAKEESLRRTVRSFVPTDGDADEFEELLASGEPDTWRSDRQAAMERRASVEAEAKSAREDAGKIAGHLDEAGRSEATQAETAKIETARGELREAVERYAPLAILNRVLDRAAVAARREEPPLLEEIGQLLSRITGGRHHAVKRTPDDRLIVIGRSDESRDAIDIERSPGELSQGTRELLYLAVRLAFVRDRAERSPVPLVLDDVLVNMDEGRQRAVLETLSELAESTQVILLTCHAKTVEIAKSLRAPTFASVSLG